MSTSTPNGRSHGTPSSSSRRSSMPAPVASSSSRFSTPLQHSAVTRLRPARASYTPPMASTSTSPSASPSDAYTTPRSSRSVPSRGHSSDPFVSGGSPGPQQSPRTPIQGTPSRRKGTARIIRSQQKSWYQRLAALPQDLWDRYELQLNESILMDLDSMEDYAYPAAFATLGLHFILRVTIGASSMMSSSSGRTAQSGARGKANAYANAAEAKLEELRRSTQGRIAMWGGFKTLIYRFTSLICWTLVILSLLNALWLFSSRRQYRLFLQRDPVNSPNAKLVKFDTPLTSPTGSDEDDERQTKDKKPSLSYKALNFAWSRFKLLWSGGTPARDRHEVQELSVWMPSTTGLRFFAIYSPPVALLVQYLDRHNLLTFLLAAAFLMLQTYLIVNSFTQLMADRQTINREVMHEYNVKFVGPRIHYPKQDASTQTNEAEMFDVREYRHGGRKARRSHIEGSEDDSGGYY